MQRSTEPQLSDREIAVLAWRLYADAPLLSRSLAAARTYICPMQPLLADVPTNARVLDIGCGNGLLLVLLHATSRCASSVGVDPNAQAMAVAGRALSRVYATDDPPQGGFVAATDPAAWPEGPFDAVTLVDAMHHVAPGQQRPVFNAACAKLAPGGTLVYKDMCARPFWRATANRLHDLLMARQWIHYVPLADVKRWGTENGLILHSEAYYSRYGYGHEKLVFRKPRA